jgi:hypothetical protein
VDFAGTHVEVDAVISEDAAEPFRDALAAQHNRRRRCAHFRAVGETGWKFWSS